MTEEPYKVTISSHDTEIDKIVWIINEALEVISDIYPPLKIAAPFLRSFIKMEATKLKDGIKSGIIVPDGQGGFVPITNSRYDPVTGRFL